MATRIRKRGSNIVKTAARKREGADKTGKMAGRISKRGKEDGQNDSEDKGKSERK